MTQLITIEESNRLDSLEKVIRAGKKTFVQVGSALAEIRDSKLYRADFSTFDKYCQEKWGWNRAYAGKLIEGADVVQSLPDNVSHGIQNERQARELSAVEPERRVEVLESAAAAAAAEDRPLTSNDIREAASNIDSDPEPIKPANVSAVEDIKAQATECADEIQVAIEDLKIITDKLGDFELEPETMLACVEELLRIIKLLRRLAKAKTDQP